MENFHGRTAVVTGAASGIGLELAREAARRGMKLVLMDFNATTLAAADREFDALGIEHLALQVDVSDGRAMARAADRTRSAFGAPHLVFNNAGQGAIGFLWENSDEDWRRVIDVDLMGVVHGVRQFTPMMIEAARTDPTYDGRIVNTASIAGFCSASLMGAYNTAKGGIISLTESLYNDLLMVTDRVSASVLCPAFVRTGIAASGSLPEDRRASQTRSQAVADSFFLDQVATATSATAADVAAQTFAAIARRQCYIFTDSDVSPIILEGSAQAVKSRVAPLNFWSYLPDGEYDRLVAQVQ